MIKQENSPRIRLPRGWPQSVKSAMLHVISLAQFGMACTREWAVNSPIARMWLKVENDQLKQDLALLKEEIVNFGYEGYPFKPPPFFIRWILRRKVKQYLKTGMPTGARFQTTRLRDPCRHGRCSCFALHGRGVAPEILRACGPPVITLSRIACYCVGFVSWFDERRVQWVDGVMDALKW